MTRYVSIRFLSSLTALESTKSIMSGKTFFIICQYSLELDIVTVSYKSPLTFQFSHIIKFKSDSLKKQLFKKFPDTI